MRKLKFINRLIAVMFMAVALVACSSSKSDDDDDDDDDGKKKEKVGKIGKNQDEDEEEEERIISSTSSVDGFCALVDEMTTAIEQASDEDEILSLQNRFKSRMEQYKNDDTPLSADEKEQVIMSLAMFGGTVIDKAVELTGEYVSEEELYNAGVAIGQQMRSIVEQSNTLAEVCGNMKGAMNNM